MDTTIQFCVSKSQARLDSYLHVVLGLESRATAQRWIELGVVDIDGASDNQKSQSVAVGQTVGVTIPVLAVEPPAVPIIYQDDDVVVYNKPAGMLTHEKANPSGEATLAHAVRQLTSDQSGNRAGIVHRLDRGTSGVVIAAKTPEAKQFLQRQFEQRLVQKTYQALVDGSVKEDHLRLDWPIARNPKQPQRFTVHANGRQAVTDLHVAKRGTKTTALMLQPQTGRTHQLRVHLLRLGHPIVGDELYGGSKANRLYLHAASLALELPSGQKKTFTAPVPAEFAALWEKPR